MLRLYRERLAERIAPLLGGPQANRAALDYLDLWRRGVYALAFAAEQGRPTLPRDAGAARTPIIR